jgi:hypothetical protein
MVMGIRRGQHGEGWWWLLYPLSFLVYLLFISVLSFSFAGSPFRNNSTNTAQANGSFLVVTSRWERATLPALSGRRSKKPGFVSGLRSSSP